MVRGNKWLPVVIAAVCACAESRGSSSQSSPDEPPSPPPAAEPPAMTPPPDNLAPPTVAITSPLDGAVIDSDRVMVEGVADDDSGLASVFVAVGPNVPVLAESSDGFRSWTASLSVPRGSTAIEAYAFDVDGRRSTAASIRIGRASPTDATAPTVSIVRPADGALPRSTTILVEGTAADDVGVVRMELLRNGEVLDDRVIETETFFSTWVRQVLLLPGVENELTFRAFDALGRSGEAVLTVAGQPEIDRIPPQLTIDTPSVERVDADSVVVSGSASDRLGVREVKVRVGPVVDGTARFGPAAFASSSDGFATFSVEVAIPSGQFTLEVKAIDVSGLATTTLLELTNDRVAEWSQEQRLPLFLRDNAPVSTVRLDLDRTGVNEIIEPSIQRDLRLFDLDPGPSLSDVLDQIKTACGTDWQLDRSEPNHNCDLTPLGRTFEGPDGRWQTSAEYSLVRILTLTPANVVVDGTSVAGLQGLADFLNLGGGFSQILAETLGISRTAEIVNTPNLVEALRTGLLAPHPATTNVGDMPITLFDAMNDLTPLGVTFGPAGLHPGILDPSTQPRGEVFTEDFLISIVAESNLRWLDGVDLNRGKDYISVVVDTRGPSFEDVLEFDFNDPSRFAIAGLAAAPTVDLRVAFPENPAFIESCNGDDACQNNLPTSPTPGFVWNTPGWEIEHVVAKGALNQYQSREVSLCPGGFCLLSEIEVGQGGNPPGWAEFRVLFNLGNPPQDQYLWGLITEVAQVALHNPPAGEIAEGAANVRFTLADVPIGMTADDIRRATRPTLQAQASLLSERLLGDFARNNGRVDFFYRRGLDGAPYIFFAAPTDLRPGPPYGYDRPGFYSDPARTTRLSSVDIPESGDDIHEKLRPAVGETVVYAEDEDGQLYRLRIVREAGQDDVVVWVSRRFQ